jgi:hypothetical protein
MYIINMSSLKPNYQERDIIRGIVITKILEISFDETECISELTYNDMCNNIYRYKSGDRPPYQSSTLKINMYTCLDSKLPKYPKNVVRENLERYLGHDDAMKTWVDLYKWYNDYTGKNISADNLR